jgi:hypothetical protein
VQHRLQDAGARAQSAASECEIKAKEALDLSVRRYFIKLAHDYRHLAELSEH